MCILVLIYLKVKLYHFLKDESYFCFKWSKILYGHIA